MGAFSSLCGIGLSSTVSTRYVSWFCSDKTPSYQIRCAFNCPPNDTMYFPNIALLKFYLYLEPHPACTHIRDKGWIQRAWTSSILFIPCGSSWTPLQCLLGQRSASVRGTGGVLRKLKATWASGLHPCSLKSHLFCFIAFSC